VVSFTPRPFYPRGKDPGTHWKGDWMGLRAGVDEVAKRKNFPAPAGNKAPVV